MKPIRFLLLISALLLVQTAHAITADEEGEVDDKLDRNPIGCLNEGFAFKMKTVELYPEKTGQAQTMYFFHNVRDEPLNLYQVRGSDSNRSLFLNHTIQPYQWAVLATNEKTVRFICSIPSSTSKYGKVVACRESMKPCAFTHVRFGLNNRGSYWIVRNGSRNGAVQGVVHYGIIP